MAHNFSMANNYGPYLRKTAFLALEGGKENGF